MITFLLNFRSVWTNLIDSAVNLITRMTVSLFFAATDRRATIPFGTIAVICMMSPPFRIFEMIAGPPEPEKSAAGENPFLFARRVDSLVAPAEGVTTRLK